MKDKYRQQLLIKNATISQRSFPNVIPRLNRPRSKPGPWYPQGTMMMHRWSSTVRMNKRTEMVWASPMDPTKSQYPAVAPKRKPANIWLQQWFGPARRPPGAAITIKHITTVHTFNSKIHFTRQGTCDIFHYSEHTHNLYYHENKRNFNLLHY